MRSLACCTNNFACSFVFLRSLIEKYVSLKTLWNEGDREDLVFYKHTLISILQNSWCSKIVHHLLLEILSVMNYN